MSRFANRPVTVIVSLFAVALSVAGATPSITRVSMRPHKVIVHQLTAEVLSVATAVLGAGEQVLELANMTSDAQDPSRSSALEEASLQVFLGEEMAQRIIWETVRRVPPDSPQIVAYQAQLADVERRLRELDNAVALAKQHDAVVFALLQQISTRFADNTTAQTIEALFARRDAMLAATALQDVERRALLAKKAEVEAALATTTAEHRVARVMVTVEDPGEVQIRTRHVIQQAHWLPSYDLHFDTKVGMVRVVYLAQVHQHTGVPWERVEVELCTGRPRKGRTEPNLFPMKVSMRDGEQRMAMHAASSHGKVAVNRGEDVVEEGATFSSSRTVEPEHAEGPRQARLYAPPKTSITAGISDVFHLHGTHSIHPRSDARLRIAELVLPATFLYSAVPLATGKVFVSAEFTNTSPYSLLPGAAMMFADSIFVGPSTLPVVGLSNSVRVEVGVDRRMEAKRQLIRATKSTETHLLSANLVTYDFEYRLRVQNNHDDVVNLRVSDVLPAKENPKAEYPIINVQSPSHIGPQGDKSQGLNATVSADGIVRWTTVLKAGASIEIPVRYSLVIPEGKTIVGLSDGL